MPNNSEIEISSKKFFNVHTCSWIFLQNLLCQFVAGIWNSSADAEQAPCHSNFAKISVRSENSDSMLPLVGITKKLRRRWCWLWWIYIFPLRNKRHNYSASNYSWGHNGINKICCVEHRSIGQGPVAAYGRWRLVSAQVVSCCVYENTKQ